MDEHRTLLLLRHAQAVDFSPGRGDIDRPLTDAGRSQADHLAEILAEQGMRVDRVLCSAALRTRETAERLNPGVDLELLEDLYNAGSETIERHVAESDPGQRVVLVVGHAPGVPTLAHALADEQTSEPTALESIARGYPPATLAVLEVTGDWAEPAGVRLVEVWHG